jgi:hypothetical protein
MATRKKDKRTDPQNNTQKNKDWDELNQVHQNELIESWYYEMWLHSMKIAFIRNSPDKTVEFFYIPDSIIRSYVFNKNYLTCDGD